MTQLEDTLHELVDDNNKENQQNQNLSSKDSMRSALNWFNSLQD